MSRTPAGGRARASAEQLRGSLKYRIDPRVADQDLPGFDYFDQGPRPNPWIRIEDAMHVGYIGSPNDEHCPVSMPVDRPAEEDESIGQGIHEVAVRRPSSLFPHGAALDPGRTVIGVHHEVRHGANADSSDATRDKGSGSVRGATPRSGRVRSPPLGRGGPLRGTGRPRSSYTEAE